MNIIFNAYDTLSANKEKIKFDLHDKFNDRHYSAIAYSPQDGFYTIILTDITDKILLIKREEDKFKNIVNNSPVGMCFFKIVSSDILTLVGSNPAAKRITGKNLSRMTGSSFLEIFPNISKENLDKIFKVAEHKITQQTIETLYRDNDFSAWLKVNIYSTLEDHITIDFLDISREKQAEKRLKSALEKEKQLSQLKIDFVSTASHQFRTPLTTLLSGTELLEMLSEDLEPEKKLQAKKFTERMYNNIDRMKNLLDDVLLVGRSQSSRTPFKPEKISFVDFINELIKKTEFENQNGRKVKISVTGEEKQLYADPQLIGHIFQNLLTNAFKYSDSEPSTEVIFKNNILMVNITDKGIGIPAEDIKHVFEPFYRSENTGTVAGTGLGLAIVKEYINMHKGTVTVKSELNKGSTFTVILPFDPFNKQT